MTEDTKRILESILNDYITDTSADPHLRVNKVLLTLDRLVPTSRSLGEDFNTACLTQYRDGADMAERVLRKLN